MTEPFVAEIRMFGFNFPPTGWAFCEGQLIPITQNTALYALLGTMYGGDGKSTFALPDMRGNAAMHWGQGQGLTNYFGAGAIGGAQTITLLQSEMPFHTHIMQGVNEQGDAPSPSQTALARPTGAFTYAPPGQPTTQMAPQSLSVAGGSLPHNNMQPYLVLNFCIAMQGVFPPRS